MKEEKALVEGKLAKVKAETLELQSQLQEPQIDLQTMQRNYATLAVQMVSLEKQLKEMERKLQNALEIEAASKEVAIMEAKKRAVAEFKESEEYKLTTQNSEKGYDKGIEEIFHNIWRKCRNDCYKLWSKEYQK